MITRFDLIAFDADDTLWHNEILYRQSQADLRALLAPYAAGEQVDETLYATEMRNLADYGYGIKSFTLSMIETALALSDGHLPAADVAQILALGKRMLAANVQLLPHVAETVSVLAERSALMLITKGDLLDQQRKLARSGLAGLFRHVEVVSDKAPATYRALLSRHRVAPERFMMVGNSLRSDILPVLALGGHAVHVPFQVTWAHESADRPQGVQDRFHELTHLGELLPLLLPPA